MRKHLILCAIVVCVTLAALSAISVNAYPAGSAPGSAGDPAVSKSYVDPKFNQLSAQIQAIQSSQQSQPSQPQADTAGYEAVRLAAGQTLIGHSGAQIILRSGKAAVYSAVPDGLCNVTRGVDLKDGAPVAANNLLIVPRGDGRGLKALESVWVLVSGGYETRG